MHPELPGPSSSGGVLYLNMKEGEGQRYEEQPGPRCPGGPSARELLRGRRFYAYYGHEELLAHFRGFEVLLERRLLPAEGGFELWLRKREGQHPIELTALRAADDSQC
jgi:hypothetical protein